MLIDWFTVGAQALNFIILIGLMQRFLYKPVLRAIDARERSIAGELAAAAAKEAEAQKQREDFQKKNEDLDHRRAALLKKATADANAERHRLFDEVRKAADAVRDGRREALRNEAENLSRALGRRAEQEVFSIARQALADLATSTLEERIVDVFVSRLGGMTVDAKATLAHAIEGARGPAVVRSAFGLPEEQRAAIETTLKGTFSGELRVRFETAPELVSGVDLVIGGYKVGWSIADYLRELEKKVGELLDPEERSASNTALTKPQNT